jgi:hypothetical protein
MSRTTKIIILVVIVLIMFGCTSTERLEVQTKMITSPPVFLSKPSKPTLSYNHTLTITPEVSQFYQDACNDFREGTALEDEYIGLDERTACHYALQCFTHNGWSNEEQDQILIKNYVERLEEQRDFYEQQLKDRYDRTKEEF